MLKHFRIKTAVCPVQLTRSLVLLENKAARAFVRTILLRVYMLISEVNMRGRVVFAVVVGGCVRLQVQFMSCIKAIKQNLALNSTNKTGEHVSALATPQIAASFNI